MLGSSYRPAEPSDRTVTSIPTVPTSPVQPEAKRADRTEPGTTSEQFLALPQVRLQRSSRYHHYPRGFARGYPHS